MENDRSTRHRLTAAFALMIGAGAALVFAASSAGARDPPEAARLQDPGYAASAIHVAVIPLHIDRTFPAAERDHILSAIDQWNNVMNGTMRFDIAPDAYDFTTYAAGPLRAARAWVIARVDSHHPLIDNPTFHRALAVSVGVRSGVIYIVHDRIGRRDLTGIVMHELGHVLGLRHDAGGRLMSPYATKDAQKCIDKGTVRALALAHGFDLEVFNWCVGPGMESIEAE